MLGEMRDEETIQTAITAAETGRLLLLHTVSQRLVPTMDGGQTAVFEVMTVNSAVQNMIRDGKTYQMENVIYSGSAGQTMLSMDNELLRLYRAGRISQESALSFSVNQDALRKRLSL